MKNSKKSAVGSSGAALLAASNLLCRIFGFLFRIPLANLIGSEGMGYFSISNQIFGAVTVISAAGLPVALSRETAARTDSRERSNALRSAIVALAFCGALSAIGLGVFAKPLSAAAGSPAAYMCVIAAAPAALFGAVSAARRGYLQGCSSFSPLAASHTAEAAVRLVLGIAAAWLLWSRGFPPEAVAAGAVLGQTLGSAAGSATLRKAVRRRSRRGSFSFPELAKLMNIAMPVTLGAACAALLGAADAAVILRGLSASGADTSGAASLYGAYSGYAMTVLFFPCAITSAISASLLPRASAAASSGDTEMLKSCLRRAFRLSGAVVLPAAALFYAVPRELLSLIYSRASDISAAAPLLKTMAPGLVLNVVASLCTVTLTAQGRAFIPVIAACAGGLLRLGMNYFLLTETSLGISAAAYSSVACWGVTAAICFIALFIRLKFLPGIFSGFVSPLVSGASGAVAALLCLRILPPLPDARLTSLSALAAAGAVCVPALLFTGSINLREIKILLLQKRGRNG